VLASLALIAGAVGLFWRSASRQAIESLAVLPFVNASGDSEAEYLSDGVTESLINILSRLPKLKVMSRSAAFRFKGRESDVVAAGRELGVQAVLTGRIIIRGENLSISTELIDPLSYEASSLLGLFLYMGRRYDDAIGELDKTLDLEPNYWPGQSWLGHAYARKGRTSEAVAAIKKALSIAGPFAEPLSALGIAYAIDGRRVDAQKSLEQLHDRAKSTYVSPYNIATVYAALGDRDQAFAWLEKAYEGRSWYITFLRVDPDLDSLRSDPRFRALMQRVGLRP
jgi:TolB-like protein